MANKYDKILDEYREDDSTGLPHIIRGTVATAAATAAKEVTIAGYTLTAGDILCITYTLGTTVGSPTLNVNGGGALSIYLGSTAANAVTHTVGANGEIFYYYTGSEYQMFGSMRTTDADSTQAVYWGATATAGTAFGDYKLLMQTADGKWHPLTIEEGTGTTKTISTQYFLVNSPILYYATTVNVAQDATFTLAYQQVAMANSLRYTDNQATRTDQKPIFLKGTIDANGFKLDNTSYTSFLTQTLPTTDDGFVYIYLGHMYANNNMLLTVSHPIYQFKDGALRVYSPVNAYTLPTATDTVLGGVKIGDRLTIADSVLSADEITIVDEYADLAALDSSITKAIVRYDTLASRSYTTLDGNTLYEKLYVNPLPPLYSETYADIYYIYTGQLMTLDTAATPADFAVGATVTGASSGVSCKIGAKLTSLTYTIIKPTGSFTDGETLSDGTNSANQGTGYPTVGVNASNGSLEASEDTGFRLWTIQLTGVYLGDVAIAVQQNYIGGSLEMSFDGKSYLRLAGGWIDNLAYVDVGTDEVTAVTMYDKKADTVSAFAAGYILPASDDAANWHRIKYALQPTEFGINYSGIYQNIASVWTLIVRNDKLDNANIGVPLPS